MWLHSHIGLLELLLLQFMMNLCITHRLSLLILLLRTHKACFIGHLKLWCCLDCLLLSHQCDLVLSLLCHLLSLFKTTFTPEEIKIVGFSSHVICEVNFNRRDVSFRFFLRTCTVLSVSRQAVVDAMFVPLVSFVVMVLCDRRMSREVSTCCKTTAPMDRFVTRYVGGRVPCCTHSLRLLKITSDWLFITFAFFLSQTLPLLLLKHPHNVCVFTIFSRKCLPSGRRHSWWLLFKFLSHFLEAIKSTCCLVDEVCGLSVFLITILKFYH